MTYNMAQYNIKLSNYNLLYKIIISVSVKVWDELDMPLMPFPSCILIIPHRRREKEKMGNNLDWLICYITILYEVLLYEYAR